jgi:hypothetical protein
MSASQLGLFELSTSLVDTTIEQRLAAAGEMLDTDPDLSVDDRRRLLLLVVCPQVYGEAGT